MNSAEIKLVSVIVVVKNDRGIDATLDHIHQSKLDAPFEVIVVDASEPSVLADIRDKHKWVKWDQFPVSNYRTTPAQRNRGLELARGDVIVFIDANCVPVDGWLESIVGSIRAGESIVCGPVLDLSQNNLVHYVENLPSGKYVEICSTINVGLRREVFDAVGSFDKSFSYGQDIDFFWRARDAGIKIYYNPAVAISHNWGKPKEQFLRSFEYGKSRAHLFKKHWHNRRKQLLHEAHVWVYPAFIIGLPITYIVPFYPLLILIPVIKNRSNNPLGLVLHHLTYGVGVIVGAIKLWPKETPST